MDFRLSEEQDALGQVVRDLCADRVPMDALRRLDGVGFDLAIWREFADVGVFTLRLPEFLGLGCVEAAVVFAELAR